MPVEDGVKLPDRSLNLPQTLSWEALGMRPPRVSRSAVAWVARSEMVEVDRRMTDDLGIQLIQMMENAGRHLASLAIARFDPVSAVVLVGSGGNGGGGMVAARHLSNLGVDVSVCPTRAPEEIRGTPAHQLGILLRMGVAVVPEPEPADLVIDAVIGYSLDGMPSGRAADLIRMVPDLGEDVLALDTPSGLDVDSGTAPGLCVEATATMTLAAPKRGLASAAEVGELYLADISVPPSVITDLDVGPAPDFRAGALLRVE